MSNSRDGRAGANDPFVQSSSPHILSLRISGGFRWFNVSYLVPRTPEAEITRNHCLGEESERRKTIFLGGGVGRLSKGEVATSSLLKLLPTGRWIAHARTNLVPRF